MEFQYGLFVVCCGLFIACSGVFMAWFRISKVLFLTLLQVQPGV